SRYLLAVGAERLSGHPGPRGRRDDLGELLDVPRAAAVLARGVAAVLADLHRGARPGAAGPGPGGPAAGRRTVRSGGRQHVPAAAAALPRSHDHGLDGLVRGL